MLVSSEAMNDGVQRLKIQGPVYKQSFREKWPALAANTPRMGAELSGRKTKAEIMNIILTQGIFTDKNSFHITFAKLVSNDASIRIRKITLEQPLLYLLQTAVSKVEVRR